MQSQHIALVPERGGLSPSELLRVSAALQKQVITQFGPLWEIHATVDAFAEIEDVPAGYRPIVLSTPDKVGPLAGIYLDENGQPYGRVGLTPGWSLAASRVCLEMLLNPFGQRTISAPSPRSDQGPAEILIEACSAFGDVSRAYLVNDVPVADFCTPAYYEAGLRRANERYSFGGGSFNAALQLLRGGHLAWFDAISNSWWLRSHHDEHPSDVSLGALRLNARSVRELVMNHEPRRALSASYQEPFEARVGLSWMREQAQTASRARAQRLRELLVDPGSQDGDLVVEAPLELLESRGDLPRLSAARELSVEPPLRDYEHELRETIAEELDGALEHELEAAPVASEPPALEPHEATGGEPVPEKAVARADKPTLQWGPASVSPPAPETVVRTVPAQAVSGKQTRAVSAPAAGTERAQLRPPPASSDVASARESVPPALPKRPSSIAPIAMLDADARPQSSRLGVMLAGAGVMALLVISLWRSDSARSLQPPHAAAPAAPASTQPKLEAVSPPAPSVPPLAQADGGAAAARPAPSSQQATNAPIATKPGDKRRHKPRVEADGAQAARETASKESQPASIENLFDTRR
jgi:hypothetical protein